MNEDIMRAREAVQSLFLNPTTLRVNATDYDVEQAAQLVACITDPLHTKEKLCLLEQVKLAKRLSRKRNLVNYGDFESSEWAGENGWKTSKHVFVASDNPIFTGRYLHLPSANQTQLSNQIFPTYAYQKIEEAKLKPYTRYSVRAFIGSSTDLEVFVTRYDKEVHKNMQVPNDLIPTNPCTGDSLVDSYPVIPHHTPDHSCGNRSHRMIPQTNVVCADPHEWQCHIDTGELNMTQNLGIWVGFKIGTTDGMANIDHVEVVEVGPLTGDALTRMKKREQRWQNKQAEKRMRIERAVQTAKEAIQALFTDANQNRLQAAITLKQILEAEIRVQQIPYVYNPFLVGAIPVVPGETYDVFLQLSDAAAIARSLHRQRNMLRNGDFTGGLSNWNATEEVEVQEIGNASVLKLLDWTATVSQHVCVKPERSYQLRVTARKADAGEGYVTISDGTVDNTETLKFTAEEATTSVASAFPAYSAAYSRKSYTFNSYEIDGYSRTTDIAMNPGTGCGCGCNTIYETDGYGNTMTNHQEMGCGCYTNDGYDHQDDDSMIEQNTFDLSGYITKTVEIFPETNRVCMEIGETAGTFEVVSVELISIGCE